MPCYRCNPNWNAMNERRLFPFLSSFLDIHLCSAKAEQSCNNFRYSNSLFIKKFKNKNVFSVIFLFHSKQVFKVTVIYVFKFDKIAIVTIYVLCIYDSVRAKYISILTAWRTVYKHPGEFSGYLCEYATETF